MSGRDCQHVRQSEGPRRAGDLRVGSLFSGIGGIDLGLERAGMRVVFQCEADPWRRAVLRSHWPDVPCFEDVRLIGGRAMDGTDNGYSPSSTGLQEHEPPDLLCGGFPCQDLSVAGRRAGLAGARSSLFFEFARIADAVRPRWLLIENVPGLLSSNGGRDFAVVYATLAELGYGLAWRVLDSRHFGVPQRRRRVFIVGHLGATGPEPFLPFLEGGGGDSPTGREAGTDSAVASLSGLGSGDPDDNDGQGGRLVVPIAADALRGEGTALTPSPDAEGSVRLRDPGLGVGTPGDPAFTLAAAGPGAVAAPLSHDFNPNSNAAGRRREDDENLIAYGLNTNRGGNADVCLEEEGAPPITSSHGNPGGVMLGNAVRRLTPTECCRLQGFPDDWLGPPNEPPDSPRYAALGDAVTVNVAHWIGQRILEADRNLRSVAA